jgi:hypothetical protein
MNENQGAESTLSFLIAVAEMRAADRMASKLVVAPTPITVAKARPDHAAEAVPIAKESGP